jgi:hypothetical protein
MKEVKWIRVKKKPVVVEAYQWLGESDKHVKVIGVSAHGIVFGQVRTREGPHKVTPGYWIIKGIKGELYGCDPEIFLETYELIDSHKCRGEFTDGTKCDVDIVGGLYCPSCTVKVMEGR